MFTKDTIAEITKVANDNGYEPAALLAVADVESAGTAFWNVGGKPKPAVRFEGHYFYARLTGADRDKAVSQGLASPKAGAVANPSNFAARYALIDRAALVNKDAAYESVSWGIGQVMGANWKDLGYKSVQELKDTTQSLSGQILLLIQFVEANGLKDEIDNGEWASFAKQYNGSAYKKNAYDKKLKAAYNKYRQPSTYSSMVEEYQQLQSMLNKITPEYALTEDGVFGAKTKVALRDFQLKNGLKVDGIYGPLSRSAVEKAYLAIINNNNKNTGIGASTIATVGTAITTATQAIEPLAKVSQIAQYVFLGLLVLGVLFTLKTVFFSKKSV